MVPVRGFKYNVVSSRLLARHLYSYSRAFSEYPFIMAYDVFLL